jgi:uncharacterized protein YecE (DUF72 family)
VPEGFQFSVKLHKTITHVERLAVTSARIRELLAPIFFLGKSLGSLLVQLPPSLHFEATVAEAFFAALRSNTGVPIVCEPRHPSWLEAAPLFHRYKVGKVIADPEPLRDSSKRFVDAGGITYVRLHGHPKIYYSDYSDAFLERVAAQLQRRREGSAWVIFDNTADYHAVPGAQRLRSIMESMPPISPEESETPLRSGVSL